MFSSVFRVMVRFVLSSIRVKIVFWFVFNVCNRVIVCLCFRLEVYMFRVMVRVVMVRISIESLV